MTEGQSGHAGSMLAGAVARAVGVAVASIGLAWLLFDVPVLDGVSVFGVSWALSLVVARLTYLYRHGA